jgi:hypothetical protein
VHVEQADKDVDYGPHVGLSTGPFNTELQYYLDLEEGNVNQAVRLVMALSFASDAPQ